MVYGNTQPSMFDFFAYLTFFILFIYGCSMCMVWLFNLVKTGCLMLSECFISMYSVLRKCCTLPANRVSDPKDDVTVTNELAEDLIATNV
jgi:hypothetical protein